jgi:catechol 2,3-dioxygenase-like lactoylglutathione lyase family enzyme
MATQQTTPTAASAAMRYSGRLTCAVGVSDFARSLDWYERVLGFETVLKLETWGWAQLQTPISGVLLGIGQSEQVHPEGGATLTFGVADIDAARARLEALDVRFDGETHQVEDMVKLATFYDPDGNTFMLAEVLDERGRGA